MGTEKKPKLAPVIQQSRSTEEKYRARWRPDCPGATGNPRRTVEPEGYVQMNKTWTQSNYPSSSQGEH